MFVFGDFQIRFWELFRCFIQRLEAVRSSEIEAQFTLKW